MKVLIVDDEKIVRKGIVSILQQAFPDMQTIAEASNGEEAMKTVKTLLPDIVITDVKMPVIDGMELTKMIHTFDAEIKVIVLSSYDDYTYVRQCMKHGAIDYLLKPIDKHEFLSLINLLRVNENASMCIAATDPNELINDAKNYIRKHYSEDISLTKVAEYVHLNPSYFSNLFSQKTGENFSAYLNNVRILHAKQLLLNPNIKIYEVGEKVGFSDPASFNRSFKRTEGISPSKFREQFCLY